VVTFVERDRHGSARSLELPCGRCVGCRLERSRQWAVRCMHEAQMHDANCFITLTYDEKHLPEFLSLRYRDFQLFMKRLRKFTGHPVRFFMCGEYGGRFSRPHFHACLFGFDFPDKVQFRRVGGGEVLYRSSALERLWPLGFSTIGAVTFGSAAYVARYVMKKVVGEGSFLHYGSVDKSSGEVSSRCPEFCRMSLGGRSKTGGIGQSWLLKYWSDVFPHGKVVTNGVEAKSPRYYDRLYDRVDSDGYAGLVFDRASVARQYSADSSPDRLAVREVVARARLARLKRSL